MLTRKDYIALYNSLAVKIAGEAGLFPSVILAQAIIESNNGNSLLASQYKNHFGIKAGGSWTGKSVNLNTREVIGGSSVTIADNFRVYDTVEGSYKDWAEFLQVNPRYKNAGVFTATTPMQQAEALQRAGYATDPNYASIITSVIEHENLGAFDKALAYSRAYVKDNPFTVTAIVVLFILLISLLYNRFK